MSRWIDIDDDRNCYIGSDGEYERWNIDPDVLDGAKTTIEERKNGEWIYGEDEYGIDGYHCDKCGFFVPWDYAHKFINYIEDYNFCPHCGADMRGERNDND